MQTQKIGLVRLKTSVEVKLVDQDGNVIWSTVSSNTDTVWAKLHTPVDGTLTLDLVADKSIEERLGGDLAQVQKTCWNQADNLRSNLLETAFTHDADNKRYEASFNWTNTDDTPRRIYALVAFVDDNVYATFAFDPPIDVDPSIVFIGKYIIEYTDVTPELEFGGNMTIDTIDGVNRTIGVYPVIDRGFRLYKLTRGVAKSSEYFGIDTTDVDFSSVVFYTYSNSDPEGLTFPDYRMSGELRWAILVSGEPNGATAVRKFVTRSVLASPEEKFWEDGDYTPGNVPALPTRDIFIDLSDVFATMRRIYTEGRYSIHFTEENEFERYVYEGRGWKVFRGGDVKPFLYRFPNDTLDIDALSTRYETASLVGFFPWLKCYGADAGYFIAYLYWNDVPTFNVRFVHGDDVEDRPTEVYLYLNGTKFTATLTYVNSSETIATFDLSTVSAGEGVVVLKVLPLTAVARIQLSTTSWKVGDWSFAVQSDMWGYVVPYAGAFKDGTTISGNWINSAFFNLNGNDVALDDIGALSDTDIANLAPVNATPLTVLDERKWPFWVWVRAGDLNTTVGVLDDTKPLYFYVQGSGLTYESGTKMRAYVKYPIYNADTQSIVFGTALFEHRGSSHAWLFDPSQIAWLTCRPNFENDHVKKDWDNREVHVKSQNLLIFKDRYETEFFVVRRQGDTVYNHFVPATIADYTPGESTKDYAGTVYEFETTLTQQEQLGNTTFEFDSSSVFTNGEFFTVPVADDSIIVPIDALETWNYSRVDFPLQGSIEWVPAWITIGTDDLSGNVEEGVTTAAKNFFVTPHLEEVEDLRLATDISIGGATHRITFEVLNYSPCVLYIPKIINQDGTELYVDTRSLVVTDGLHVYPHFIDPFYFNDQDALDTAIRVNYWPVVVVQGLEKMSASNRVSFTIYAYFQAKPFDELDRKIRVTNHGRIPVEEGSIVRIALPYAVTDKIRVNVDGNPAEFCLLNEAYRPGPGNLLYVKLPAMKESYFTGALVGTFVAARRAGADVHRPGGAGVQGTPHFGYGTRNLGTMRLPKDYEAKAAKFAGPLFERGGFLNTWTDVPYGDSYVEVEILPDTSPSGEDPATFFPVYITSENPGTPVFYNLATAEDLDVVGYEIRFSNDAGSMEWQISEDYSMVEAVISGPTNIWFWAANNLADYTTPYGDTELSVTKKGVKRYCLGIYEDLEVVDFVLDSPAFGIEFKGGSVRNWKNYGNNNIYIYRNASIIAIIGYKSSPYLIHDFSGIPVFSSVSHFADTERDGLVGFIPSGEVEQVTRGADLLLTDQLFADRHVAAYRIPLKDLASTDFRVYSLGAKAKDLDWKFPVFVDRDVVSPLSEPGTEEFYCLPQYQFSDIFYPVLIGFATDDEYVRNVTTKPYDAYVGWVAEDQRDSNMPMVLKKGFVVNTGNDFRLFVPEILCNFFNLYSNHYDGCCWVNHAKSGFVVFNDYSDVSDALGLDVLSYECYPMFSPAANHIGWWWNFASGRFVTFSNIDMRNDITITSGWEPSTILTDVLKVGIPHRYVNFAFLNNAMFGNEIYAFAHMVCWIFYYPTTLYRVFPLVEVRNVGTDEVTIFGICRSSFRTLEITELCDSDSADVAKIIGAKLAACNSYMPFNDLLSIYGTSDFEFRIGFALCYVGDLFEYSKLLNDNIDSLCERTSSSSRIGIVGDSYNDFTNIPAFFSNNPCVWFYRTTTTMALYFQFKYLRGTWVNSDVLGYDYYKRILTNHSCFYDDKSVPVYTGLTRCQGGYYDYMLVSWSVSALSSPIFGAVGITGFSAEVSCSDTSLTDVPYCFYNKPAGLYFDDLATTLPEPTSYLTSVYNPNSSTGTYVVRLDVSDYDFSSFSNGLVATVGGVQKPTAYETSDGKITTDFALFDGKTIYVRTELAPEAVTQVALEDIQNTYDVSDVFDFYDDFVTPDKWNSLQRVVAASASGEDVDNGVGAESTSQRVAAVSVVSQVTFGDDGLTLLPDGQGESGIAGLVSVDSFGKDLVWEVLADGPTDRLQIVFGDCNVRTVRIPAIRFGCDDQVGILLKANFSPNPNVKYKVRIYDVGTDVHTWSDFYAIFVYSYDKRRNVWGQLNAVQWSVCKPTTARVSLLSFSSYTPVTLLATLDYNTRIYVDDDKLYVTGSGNTDDFDDNVITCLVGNEVCYYNWRSHSNGVITAPTNDWYIYCGLANYVASCGADSHLLSTSVVDEVNISGTIDVYTYSRYFDVTIKISDEVPGTVFVADSRIADLGENFYVAADQSIFCNANSYLTGTRFGQSDEIAYVVDESVETNWYGVTQPIVYDREAKKLNSREAEIYPVGFGGSLSCGDVAFSRLDYFKHTFWRLSDVDYPWTWTPEKALRGSYGNRWLRSGMLFRENSGRMLTCDVGICASDSETEYQVETKKAAAAPKVVGFGEFLYRVVVYSSGEAKFEIEYSDERAEIELGTSIPDSYKVGLLYSILDTSELLPLKIRRITARPAAEKDPVQLRKEDTYVVFKALNTNWYLVKYGAAGTPDKAEIENAITVAEGQWSQSLHYRPVIDLPTVPKALDDFKWVRMKGKIL